MSGRTRAFVAAVGGVVLAVSSGVGAIALSGQDAPALGGFQVDGQATGMRWIYRTEQSPVPAENTGEFSGPFTSTELATGPSGRGLASSAWPGDTAANACAAAPIPCWSIRAEAFFPQGPTEQENKTPGASMESSAAADYVMGEGRQSDSTGPPGISTGDLTALSESFTHPETVEAHGFARASDIAIGQVGTVAGPIASETAVLAIDSVKSDVRAISDSKAVTFEGGTVASGATVAGQPAQITEDGIELGDGDPNDPLNAVKQSAARTALDQSGIEAFLVEPVTTRSGGEGQIVAGGVMVVMDGGRAENQLPAAFNAFTGAAPNQEFIVIFAQAAAGVAAQPPIDFSLPTPGDAPAPAAPVPSATPAIPDAAPIATGEAPAPLDTSAAPTGSAAPILTQRTGFTLPGGFPVTLLLVSLAIGGSSLAAWGLRKLATDVFESAEPEPAG